MKKISKKNLFLIASATVFIAIAIVACSKENASSTNDQQGAGQSGAAIQYDNAMLGEFKDYQNAIASHPNTIKAGGSMSISDFKNSRLEKLVDNYLLFQADSLLKKNKTLNEDEQLYHRPLAFDEMTTKTTLNTATTLPISGTAIITGMPNSNTDLNTSVLLQVSVNNSNTIVNSAYSVAGVHGTVAQVGSLEQTQINGVTTFKLYLSITYNFPVLTSIGTTDNVMVYGNVYKGQLAMGAMVVQPPPVP